MQILFIATVSLDDGDDWFDFDDDDRYNVNDNDVCQVPHNKKSALCNRFLSKRQRVERYTGICGQCICKNAGLLVTKWMISWTNSPGVVTCWSAREVGFVGTEKLAHYCGVIMGAVASEITSLTIVYSTVYSDADQRKHQSSVSLAFVWGIYLGSVNSPHKWPVTRKMFPFDDVIMRFGVNSNDRRRTLTQHQCWPSGHSKGQWTADIDCNIYKIATFHKVCLYRNDIRTY